MTLPALNPSDLRPDNLNALAEAYAHEARSLLVPSLLDEDEARAHPHLAEPLGSRQLQQVAMHRGVVSIESQAPIASDGQLIPLPHGGFRLRIAAGSSDSRRRFTMAHEIAHTYFSDVHETSSKNRHDSRVDSHSSHVAKLEERFCDSFAARLLLPEKSAFAEFRQLLDTDTPSEFARQIEQIGIKWGTSTRATLIRLNETVGLPAGLVAVVLRWKTHNRTGTQPACRVESFYPRPAVSWFLPSNQRASTIGLHGAIALFEHWQSLRQPLRTRGGFWTMQADQADNERHSRITEAPGASTNIAQQLIMFTKRPDQPWRKTSIDSFVNYRLYAAARSRPYCLAFVSVPPE